MASPELEGSMGPVESRELAATLRRARRRLMARRALESSARVLPSCAALVALVVAAQSVLGPRSPFALDPGRLALLAAAALVAPLLVAAIHGAISGRLSDLALALLVDRGLDLKERATAAVALRSEPDAGAWAARALEALRARDVTRALPYRALPWRAAAVACAALVGAFFLPAWPVQGAAPLRSPDPKVVATAKTLEEQAKKAEETLKERGAAEEAKRALQDVQRAAQRAQAEPLSREDQIKELERIDQKVRREQEQRQAADAGALQRALSSIEQAAAQRDASRQADGEEARSLEQQLQSLAKEFSQGKSFEDREKQRISTRIKEAADALRSSNPDLANQLDQLADAIAKGDGQKAAEIAQQLANSAAMQQLSADAATNEGLQEARKMVQQAMAQLGKAQTDEESKAAREAAEAAMEGQAGASGAAGKGSRPGDAPGDGKDRSGRAIVQTDWGVGSTNEASPEFRLKAKGQQADRQSTETSDWREAYEAMNDSQRLEDATGRNTRVEGSLGEGDIVSVQTRTTSQGAEQATLPALRVPESYERANEEALAREEIPSAYKDGVRKYFTSLDGDAKPATATAPAPATTPKK